MPLKTQLAAALCALSFAGCSSFTAIQTVKFVDDDGRFVDVVYGVGDEAHSTTFTSPVNGKEIELKSKLRVKVSMQDGPSFKAFQCMNMLGSGTMYKTDNDRWMYLANGFTCVVFELEEDGPKKGDYKIVFQGVLCQAPKDGRRK